MANLSSGGSKASGTSNKVKCCGGGEGEGVQSKGKITDIFLRNGRGALGVGRTIRSAAHDRTRLPLPMKMRLISAVDGGGGRIEATAIDWR